MSIHKPPTVKAWQHTTDPDRVLLVWPDGKSMVVNAGRYIEDEPTMEPPDNWQPIGKHPTGTLRQDLNAHYNGDHRWLGPDGLTKRLP